MSLDVNESSTYEPNGITTHKNTKLVAPNQPLPLSAPQERRHSRAQLVKMY